MTPAKLSEIFNKPFSALDILREGGSMSYMATSGEKKYFLKLVPSAFGDTVKESTDVLLYLEQKCFPSARIIKTADNAPLFEHHGKIGVMFEYIDGDDVDMSVEIAEQVGELCGSLHSKMKDYQKPLPRHGKEFFIDRYIEQLKSMKISPLTIEQSEQCGSELWERVKYLPHGFCHGDMHAGNLLRSKDGELYLLDFDSASDAFPLYDIALMCNATHYFDFDAPGYGYDETKEIYEQFLVGYEKHCILTTAEKASIYDFIGIYHFALQATMIEIYGLDCVNEQFIDSQLHWLMRWRELCEIKGAAESKCSH
jgi:Ser/Thr protein kinase RdoA (MazF antagonist)